jgi:Holliday junction resolvase
VRLRGRRDGNHRAIVEALRDRGLSVLDLGGVGSGCPDLLVGTRMGNLLVEIKDGSRSPSRRRLTEDEMHFHATWRGPHVVATSAQDVVDVLIDIGWLPGERK